MGESGTTFSRTQKVNTSRQAFTDNISPMIMNFSPRGPGLIIWYSDVLLAIVACIFRVEGDLFCAILLGSSQAAEQELNLHVTHE